MNRDSYDRFTGSNDEPLTKDEVFNILDNLSPCFMDDSELVFLLEEDYGVDGGEALAYIREYKAECE